MSLYTNHLMPALVGLTPAPCLLIHFFCGLQERAVQGPTQSLALDAGQSSAAGANQESQKHRAHQVICLVSVSCPPLRLPDHSIKRPFTSMNLIMDSNQHGSCVYAFEALPPNIYGSRMMHLGSSCHRLLFQHDCSALHSIHNHMLP